MSAGDAVDAAADDREYRAGAGGHPLQNLWSSV